MIAIWNYWMSLPITFAKKNNDAMKLDELLLRFGSFQIELQYLKNNVLQ
jgi:hypothetical protein